MYKKGILKVSRNSNFNKDQTEYIRKRYVEDWISYKNIGIELGLKGESVILKVVEELNIKRNRSDWTKYNNLNRKDKNE
jgi:predicted GNAT superfamily acetyltransferase